jgi:hypothetical protein
MSVDKALPSGIYFIKATAVEQLIISKHVAQLAIFQLFTPANWQKNHLLLFHFCC